jgi:hypothetical protein
VTPAARREAVAHLRVAYEVSERRACSALGADCTSRSSLADKCQVPLALVGRMPTRLERGLAERPNSSARTCLPDHEPVLNHLKLFYAGPLNPPEFALYRHALVLFVCVSDAVLKLTISLWQLFCDLISAMRPRGLRTRFGAEMHNLADLEFVPNHVLR